ncbi:MAG: transposase [Bdellovibrionales bacterium]|nr:transposase [Bdellovibrionales bacterium]
MGHRKSKEVQLSLFKRKIIRQFGGALLKGNAKIVRPLTTKEPMHLVLKSAQAIGTKSMLHNYNVSKIDEIIRTHARLCRIRIYHLVNVGNHLHLVIKLDDRKKFSKFIRVITGLIARHVLKAQRGAAGESKAAGYKKNQFWVARPFTRLIAWGRDYEHITKYMKKNINDAKRCFIPWGFDTTDPMLIQMLNTA